MQPASTASWRPATRYATPHFTEKAKGRDSMSILSPSVFVCMRFNECPQQVGIPLEHVRYLEAHATGTTVGDKIGKSST